MRKNCFLALAAFALTLSCQKAQDNLFEPDPLDDGNPVKVLLGTNVMNATTKGNGPLENFSNTALSIFAIDKASTDWTTGNPFLMKNYSITAESGKSQPSIVTPIYYNDNVNYKFYGYYVDDLSHLDNNLTVTANSVTLPVAITGYEDILLAKTNEAEDYKDAQQQAQNDNKKFNTERVYSSYSARRNVVPKLVFTHQLTRLDFIFKTGEAIDENTKVEIVGISVKSVKNGTLTVAGDSQGLVPALETEEALVMKFPTEQEPIVMPKTTDPGIATYTNNSIMVYPKADKYDMSVTLRQSKKNGETWVAGSPVSRDFEVKLTDASAFEAGKKYEVTIVTYGLEPVIVGVELTQWERGDDILIDSDE